MRYDVELAVQSMRDKNDADADYFVRESLWYYSCFVRELEDFTCRRGGLWVTPNPAAEQTLADAVWLLRKPTVMNQLDDSVLRLAVTGYGELAVFVQATYNDAALLSLTERWRTWVESCACADPRAAAGRVRRPPVHEMGHLVYGHAGRPVGPAR
jgi:hypothetical protein